MAVREVPYIPHADEPHMLLEAGEEIEALVDDNAMRDSWHGPRPFRRRYSRNLGAAMFALVHVAALYDAKLSIDTYEICLLGCTPRWTVTMSGGSHTNGDIWECTGHAETLPLAICRALLHIASDDNE